MTEVPMDSHPKRALALLVVTASVGYVCRTAMTVVAPGIMAVERERFERFHESAAAGLTNE